VPQIVCNADLRTSHVLTILPCHAYTDASRPQDRRRYFVRIWAPLYPLLDSAYCADHIEGRNTKVTRPKVADNVDHYRVLYRYDPAKDRLLESFTNSLPAVVIGCCPMLAAGIPRSAKRADYDVHGYARDSASQTKGSRPDYTRMRSVESSLGPCEKHRSDLFWNDACESQEELALVPAPVRALLLMERGERQICPDGDRCRFYQQMRQLRSIP
jgi:hypothetical protein